MTGLKKAVTALGMVAALGMASYASAGDWPQFLGPYRDGVAHDSPRLARSWPANGPKMLWEIPVGLGYGGAAIYGDSVLILDRAGTVGDVIRRIRLADGTDVWKRPYDAPGKHDHDGSRSTPATDGNLVFCVGPFGHLTATRYSDGQPVWGKNILRDWDAEKPAWGVSCSPLLYGNWVIVMPLGKKAALVAYDKATGNVVWTTPNPKGVVQEYQSPMLMKLDGQDMILATGKRGYLIGADAQTGRWLWDYTGYPDTGWQIPSPAPVGDGRILMTGGYGQGCVMIRIARQGQEYQGAELFKNKVMGSSLGQPLLWNGHIYGNADNVGGGLRCLDLNGNVLWDSKTSGATFGPADPIIADGLIFITHGGNGDLFMAEATPEGYKTLGKANLLAGPEPWCPLAFKDGKLVVRDQHRLVCLDMTVGQ